MKGRRLQVAGGIRAWPPGSRGPLFLGVGDFPKGLGGGDKVRSRNERDTGFGTRDTGLRIGDYRLKMQDW
jgi:hypothetical protein